MSNYYSEENKEKREISSKLSELANSWPPHNNYTSLENIEFLLSKNSKLLGEIEGQRGGGNYVYLYAKLKMHADYYGLPYAIPSNYQEACENRIKEMTAPARMKQNLKLGAIWVGIAGASLLVISMCSKGNTVEVKPIESNTREPVTLTQNLSAPEMLNL